MFSIWNERNECLSWEDTEEWAQLLGLELAPVFYKGKFSEDSLRGFRSSFPDSELEGWVIRNAHAFSYGAFRKNVGKYVRAEHVRTNTHWIKTRLIKNDLASRISL